MYGIVKCLPTSRRNSSSRHLAQPVEVVDHDRRVRAVEVEEALELGADRGDVRLERLPVEQVPLGRRPRRVADHPGPAADERDRPAAVALEVEQPEDRHEVADVERGSRRVEPVVGGDRAAGRESRRRDRASRRGACRASAARRGVPAGRPRAARPPPPSRPPSQARNPSRLDVRSRGRPTDDPYAIVRADMQTSLARRQRHRRLGIRQAASRIVRPQADRDRTPDHPLRRLRWSPERSDCSGSSPPTPTTARACRTRRPR